MRWPKAFDVIALRVSFALGFISVWELAGRLYPNFNFVAGTPSAIAVEFVDLLVRGSLASHFAITGLEAVLGFAIGTIIGTAIGLSFWFSRTLAEAWRPFVLAAGTFPVLAFAPLMIIWFGVGFKMKVALAAFSTIFVAFSQAYQGAREVAGEYVDILLAMNANPSQIFFKVIVPGSLGWVLSSMRLNVGLALLGAFIGEFIAAQEGLGYVILRAGSLYNVPRAFAASIGITLLALGLDYAGALLENNRYRLMQLVSVTPGLLKRFGRG